MSSPDAYSSSQLRSPPRVPDPAVGRTGRDHRMHEAQSGVNQFDCTWRLNSDQHLLVEHVAGVANGAKIRGGKSVLSARSKLAFGVVGFNDFNVNPIRMFSRANGLIWGKWAMFIDCSDHAVDKD
jgi:hypothetical protein